jgi:hypothetical protein
VLTWRPLDGEGRRSTLPLPACGLVPLALGAGLVNDATNYFELRHEPLPTLLMTPSVDVLTLALTAGFAVGLVFLFNRPGKVAAFGPDAGGRVLRAVGPSTAYVLALAALGWFLSRQPGFEAVGPIQLLMVVAVLLDVIAEARAVRRHGELVAVWPEHRLYAVEAAREALERKNIPSLARSVHQRVLWHFMAPVIPIQIMVPRARAEEAGQVLREYYQGNAAIA